MVGPASAARLGAPSPRPVMCASTSRAPYRLASPLATVFVLLLGCASPPSPPAARLSAESGQAAPAPCNARRAEPPCAATSVDAPASATASAQPAAPSASPSTAGVVEACGPFECRFFDTPAAALELVLESEPLALGVGEAHALAGSERIASTAQRFADQLLPALRGRASHLIVELLQPDARCQDATREVRRVQEPVTASQSAHNQNDYVALGQRARALGIEPFVLGPTCDEYRAIAAAGDRAVDQMLVTIANVSSRMMRGALARNHAAGREAALVIGYGGALHNDIAPAEAKAAWSYGPALTRFTSGRYVELDLIVRELIRDTDVWRALPWYEFFDPARERGRFLVMRTLPSRFVLFFPSGDSADGSTMSGAAER